MGNDQYYGQDDEKEEAEDRIRRIREGGGSPPPQQYEQEPAAGRASRSDQVRRDVDQGYQPRGQSAAPSAGSAGRGRQAIIFIGGLVAIGVLVVLVIVMIGALGGGGGMSLPFLATDTPTPTATPLPTATPTETPTATPTREAPPLNLPPLTCIFQSGVGCFDYCQDQSNVDECQAAKDFVAAQGADPDTWLECVAAGPGPNQGNPQKCLEEAWRSNNP